MKRNLITKVIAGGFFTIAAFVSYAATVTTTSDYFTVDTREQEQYTIHFDANGGSGSKNDFTIGADLAELVLYPEFSESVDLPGNDGAFEKQGCCFLGWGLSSDVNGVKNGAINSDELVKTTKDLRGRFSANKECTLYAIWGKTCKVRFIGNGGRKEEDNSNEYEHVFVVGKNENLPPNMFKRGNNEFIGWTSVLPVNIDISNKDASSFRRHYIVLDCAEVCFSEMNFPDGNYEYEFYALWTVNVSYSFYNSGEYHGVMSDTTSLKPQELGNYLYWRTMADGIWHRSGERVELFPGIHTIQFKRDFNSDTSGYDWYVAFKEDTVTLSVPSYNSYWANWRFGVSAELHEKVDVGMNYSKIGTVCFDCEKEHPNSLVGVDVIPPFSYAKIRIKVYRNYDGSMVSGFECNDFYHLPEGDYVAYPSYGDKNERHGGEKYWDAVSSVPFTVRDGDITRVMINFRLVDDLVWRNTISVYFDYNGAGIDKRKVEYISLWNDQNTAIISQLPKEPMRDSDFCSKDGYYFDGWYTKRAGGIKIVEGSKVTNRTTLYAHWKVVGGGGIERLCEIVRTLAREDDVDTTLQPVSFSQTYTFNSYLQLPDDDGTAGTMTVKTQKERGGVAKATVTIQPAGGKKQTIKGTISTADGTGQGALAGLTFTASGVTGTLNGYSVDGAIDASKSKDAATVAVLNAFKGKSYVMALEPDAATGENAAMVNGIAGFSIVFSAKGKAKVTGTMPDGMKVSVSSQLIVGSEWCCLPVVYSKTGNSLAFLLWFDREGNFDSVSGMTAWKGKGFEVKWNEDVAVSKVGNLSGTSYFHLADTPAEIGGAEVISELLPVDVAITPAGAKWNIAKAKAVKLDRYGNLDYGVNPAGLKLTYTAKTGMFKGSLSLYTMNRGRLKKNSVTISGIVVNGIGYGTATLKKVGCWPIVINGEAAKAADFKARITGVAVVDEDAYDEVFAGVTFVSPETVLEVPYGKKAVFRIEYDFPTGYSAYLWVRDDWPATESENRYYVGTNPSSLYRDAGVAYGFVSLLETGKTCTLKSVKVRTQSEPAAADSAGEWEICTAAVNLTFREKNSASMTELDLLKDQFKATVTGVAVVNDSVSYYDDADVAAVTFLSPQTSLDVPYGATVLIRMSYDFPPGYAAQLWTCAAKWSAASGGSSYNNPSLQHVGKGTAYGYIGLEGHSAACTLEAIRVDAGAYLTDDGERTEWGLCTIPVNITFSR